MSCIMVLSAMFSGQEGYTRFIHNKSVHVYASLLT